MLVESRSDPGMRELQQRGAPGAEKQCRFAIDSPGNRVGTEDAGQGLGAIPLYSREAGFKVVKRDVAIRVCRDRGRHIPVR